MACDVFYAAAEFPSQKGSFSLDKEGLSIFVFCKIPVIRREGMNSRDSF